MRRGSAGALAFLAVCGGALLVPLAYAPSLAAPFLVPKFALLELAGALGWVALGLSLVEGSAPRLRASIVRGAAAVLLTTGIAWAASAWLAPPAPYALDAAARLLSLLGLGAAAALVEEAAARRGAEGVGTGDVAAVATVAAAVVAGIGLLQHVGAPAPAIPVISFPGSTFGNRNLAAEAVALALPLTLGALLGRLIFVEKRALLPLLPLALAALVEVAYLAATRARGAWLGAAAGTVALVVVARPALPGRRLGWGAATLILVAGLAAAVPGRFLPRDEGDGKRFAPVGEVLRQSVDGQSVAVRTRLGLWRRTVRMIADHPLVGVGPGNWPVRFPRYPEPGAAQDGVLTVAVAARQAHDDLLERTAETGVLGLLALLSLAAAVVGAARDVRGLAEVSTRVRRAAAAGALCALAGMAIPGFPLEMPGTLALAGVALGLISVEERAAPPPRRPVAGALVLLLAVGWLALAGLRAERAVSASRALAIAERLLASDGKPHPEEERARRAQAALDALEPQATRGRGTARVQLRRAQALLILRRPALAQAAARAALAIEPDEPWALTRLAESERDLGRREDAHRDADRALAVLAAQPVALGVRIAVARDAQEEAADRAALAALAASPDRATAQLAAAELRSLATAGVAR